MSHPDANIEELDPSASSDLDETTAAVEQQSTDADSSPATGESAPDSDLLSIVRDVVQPGDEQEEQATASPAEGEEDGDEVADPEKPKAEQDDDDYTDVPFHRHPRFQQLLRKAKTYEQDAKHYQTVQNFLERNGLAPDEAGNALIIAGLMKTNPVEAWRQLRPTVEKLLIAAGELLPEDLKERVQKGELSREAAFEISRHRAQTSTLERMRAFERERQELERQQEQARALVTAAEAWERDRRAKDPNFDAKYEALMDKVYALQGREGKPTTPEGVRDMLNRAYRALTPPARPSVPAVRQQTNSSGQVAGNQRPAEVSTLDIVRANRRAS